MHVKFTVSATGKLNGRGLRVQCGQLDFFVPPSSSYDVDSLVRAIGESDAGALVSVRPQLVVTVDFGGDELECLATIGHQAIMCRDDSMEMAQQFWMDVLRGWAQELILHTSE